LIWAENKIVLKQKEIAKNKDKSGTKVQKSEKYERKTVCTA
jgi:hypothetical protein